MHNIKDILSKLVNYQYNLKDEHKKIVHIPDTAWIQDNVEVLASMDTWISDFNRRNSNTRESVTKRIYEHMRRLRTMYGGLQYKELLHVSKLAHKTKGLWAYNIIALLERRLDIVLWRAMLSKSPRQATVMIKNGHILVNGKICKKSNYNLKPGDLITVRDSVRALYQQNIIDSWPQISTPITDSKYNPSSIAPVSVVNVITKALCHGSLADILTTNSYSLGCINYTTKNKLSNQNKLVFNVKSTAYSLLNSIYSNQNLVKNIWAQVYHGVHLENNKESALNIPYCASNIEVNYKTMSIIYLYTPQRVIWTSLIDMELLQTHLV